MYRVGKPAQAMANVAEIVTLAHRLGNANWLGYATIGQGYETHRRGDSQRGAGFFKEAINLFAAVDDHWGEMNASYGLALALHALNDLPSLVSLIDASSTSARRSPARGLHPGH